jgi:uncharacterized membrane protein YqjE
MYCLGFYSYAVDYKNLLLLHLVIVCDMIIDVSMFEMLTTELMLFCLASLMAVFILWSLVLFWSSYLLMLVTSIIVPCLLCLFCLLCAFTTLQSFRSHLFNAYVNTKSVWLQLNARHVLIVSYYWCSYISCHRPRYRWRYETHTDSCSCVSASVSLYMLHLDSCAHSSSFYHYVTLSCWLVARA